MRDKIRAVCVEPSNEPAELAFTCSSAASIWIVPPPSAGYMHISSKLRIRWAPTDNMIPAPQPIFRSLTSQDRTQALSGFMLEVRWQCVPQCISVTKPSHAFWFGLCKQTELNEKKSHSHRRFIASLQQCDLAPCRHQSKQNEGTSKAPSFFPLSQTLRSPSLHPQTPSVAVTAKDAAASLAPSPRSGGCARASPGSSGQLLPACARSRLPGRSAS